MIYVKKTSMLKHEAAYSAAKRSVSVDIMTGHNVLFINTFCHVFENMLLLMSAAN